VKYGQRAKGLWLATTELRAMGSDPGERPGEGRPGGEQAGEGQVGDGGRRPELIAQTTAEVRAQQIAYDRFHDAADTPEGLAARPRP
jgi:hypothetical protein